MSKSWWLSHKYFLTKGTMKKGIVYIKLEKWPLFRESDGKNCTYGD